MNTTETDVSLTAWLEAVSARHMAGHATYKEDVSLLHSVSVHASYLPPGAYQALYAWMQKKAAA